MTNVELLLQAKEASIKISNLLSPSLWTGDREITRAESIELLNYSRKLDCAATALECNARGIPEPKVG